MKKISCLLDIDQAIESKIRNVEFRWKSSDNVIADLSGESPFWIIKEEKIRSNYY